MRGFGEDLAPLRENIGCESGSAGTEKTCMYPGVAKALYLRCLLLFANAAVKISRNFVVVTSEDFTRNYGPGICDWPARKTT
jgi:hypothetical protein